MNAATQPDSSVSELPPELAEFLEYFGAEETLSLVAEFLCSACKSHHRLLTAFEQGDRKVLLREAHFLRGGFRAVGLVAQTRNLAEFELECASAPVGQLTTWRSAVIHEYEDGVRAVNALQKVLHRRTKLPEQIM